MTVTTGAEMKRITMLISVANFGFFMLKRRNKYVSSCLPIATPKKAIMVIKWVESETLADAVIIRASWKFFKLNCRALKKAFANRYQNSMLVGPSNDL